MSRHRSRTSKHGTGNTTGLPQARASGGGARPIAALVQEPALALDRQRETTDASLDAERAVEDDPKQDSAGPAAKEQRQETDENLDQERAEADLVTVLSQEPFRQLVEQVQDFAIFMLDVEGHVMSWNAGAERLKGYASGEIIGQSFTVFYTADALVAGEPARHLHDARERGRVESECLRVRKDGSTFMGKLIITPFHDQAGVFCGFVKITRDLSEQISRAELELQRTREALRIAKLAAVAALHRAEASRVHRRLADGVTAALSRPKALVALFVFVALWAAGNVSAVVLGVEAPDAPPFFWLSGLIGVYAALVTTSVLITASRQQTRHRATPPEDPTAEQKSMSTAAPLPGSSPPEAPSPRR